MSGFWTIVVAVLSFGTAITIGLFMGLRDGNRREPIKRSEADGCHYGWESCIDPDCSWCAAPHPGEDDADAAFESAMRMLNGEAADAAMDPMVERIVAIVQNAIVEAEAVELDECEREFLADPMHFGRRS